METYTVKVDDEGTIRWCRLDGQYHRVDGPAIEYPNGTKIWYLNGLYHRLDGPAIEWADGDKEWWLNGTEFTESEFNARVSGKELTVTDDDITKEFLQELRNLLQKYDADIGFEVSECSDTYDLHEERIVISRSINNKSVDILSVDGYNMNSNDIKINQ